MTAQHTPGRLVVGNGMHGTTKLLQVEERHIAVAAYVMPEDARRLAACWNVCEGVSTEKIEALASVGGVAVADNLIKQVESAMSQVLADIDDIKPEAVDKLLRACNLNLEQVIANQRNELARLNAVASEHQVERERSTARYNTVSAGFARVQTEFAAARALLREVSAANDAATTYLNSLGMDGMSEPARGLADRISSYLDACDTLGGGA